ncbi:IS3 family transposase [Peribacillus sp. Bi96]
MPKVKQAILEYIQYFYNQKRGHSPLENVALV